MAKIYTARDMRQKAFALELIGHDEAAAMLRLAADLMEREEKRELKYEYSVRYFDRYEKKEEVDYLHHTTPTAAARYLPWFQEAKCVVRRPVGEWEEVRDGK